MKKFFTTATAIALLSFGAAAAHAEGSAFGQIGAGFASGSAFSESTTGSASVSGTLGNGDSMQTTFTGATNLSRVTLGGQQGGGKFSGEVETLTQGESFTKSEGEQNGSAFSAGGGFATQNGTAFGESKLGAASGFVSGNGFGFGRFK